MTEHHANQQASILLVEPDADSARALLAKLHSQGHRVLHTAAEPDAIEAATANPPDAILFAPGIAGADRLGFIARVRGVPSLSGVPLLLLSHDLSDDELLRAMDRGASDFVLRPFHMAELLARVRTAIRTSRLVRLLEHRARIDPLTGLWNRLYFTERLSGSIAAAVRSGELLAVVIIDIDHFKQINDGHGHAVGDAVLQQFAAVLRKSIRAGDTACRYGGEEFAVILPRAAPEHAAMFCQRFRSLLAATHWPPPIDRPVTASYGITNVGLNREPHLQAWVEAADRALYAAKEAGRDRAHIFDPATGQTPPAMRLAG